LRDCMDIAVRSLTSDLVSMTVARVANMVADSRRWMLDCSLL
jgi:hypothetical protein